jgi:cyclohexyl-isocyanide hydratase
MSTPETPHVATIGFYLWNGMTMLDVLGPHQTLGFAPGIKTFTFARTTDPVVADTGVRFLPDYGLADVPQPDVLVVGGGANALTEMSDPEVMATFARLGAGARYVASVCTGALILAEAGLLDGYKANTHWAAREQLAAYPKVELADGRVVVDRDRFTGGGVTAGIDIALTLLAELLGPDTAAFMELLMEYHPAPPCGTGHPDIAPAELVAAARGAYAEMAPDIDAFVARRSEG